MAKPAAVTGSKPDVQGLLQEYLVDPLVQIFDDLFAEVRARDNCLVTFQMKLREIPSWHEHDQVRRCMALLAEKCPFLNELVTALFLSYIKNISAIRNTAASTVRIQMPTKPAFIHGVLVAMAKQYYENPFMFRRNDREAKLAVAHQAVDTCVVKALPVKDILDAYIGTQDSSQAEDGCLVLNSEFHGQPSEASNAAGVAASSQLIHRVIREAQENGIIPAANANLGDHPAGAPASPSSDESDASSSYGSAGSTTDSLPENPIAQGELAGSPSPDAPSPDAPGKAEADDKAEDEAEDKAPPRAESAAAPPPRAEDIKVIVSSAKSSSTASESLDILPEVAGPMTGGSTTDEREADAPPPPPQPPPPKKPSPRKRAAAGSKASATSTASGARPREGGVAKRSVNAPARPVASAAVSTGKLTKSQQQKLLDEILMYTRTREMVTPSFFSDADSKET